MQNSRLRIIFLLFFVSSACFAWTDVNSYLKITIKNNTPETCSLTHKHIFKGSVSPLSPLPQKILSGTENTFFLTDGIKIGGSSISLTYECGDSRGISFLSQRKGAVENLLNGEDIIKGEILFASDMDATYEIQHGPLTEISSSPPGAIYWVLN